MASDPPSTGPTIRSRARRSARRPSPHTRFARLTERFLKISKRLPPELLTGPESDLEHQLWVGLGAAQEDRLLGFYTRAGIEAALEAYGVYDRMRARGYQRFEVQFDLQPLYHGLRIFADGLQLADCRLRRLRGAADPCIAAFQRGFLPDLLFIEWLSLSDPRAEFTSTRPQLPGQQFPGTGVGSEVFILLYLCAKRLGLHGLVNQPERLHNAVLYRRRMRFIDPVFEGRFERLQQLVHSGAPLATVAWALERGQIIDTQRQEVVRWAPREQLLCIDPRLEAYFELPSWRRARAEARRSFTPQLQLDASPQPANPDGAQGAAGADAPETRAESDADVPETRAESDADVPETRAESDADAPETRAGNPSGPPGHPQAAQSRAGASVEHDRP